VRDAAQSGVTSFTKVLNLMNDTPFNWFLRRIEARGGVPFARVFGFSRDPTFKLRTPWGNLEWGTRYHTGQGQSAPLMISKDGDDFGETFAGFLTQVFLDPKLNELGEITPFTVQQSHKLTGATDGLSYTAVVSRVTDEQFNFLQALAFGELDDEIVEELLKGYAGIPGLTPGVTHRGVIDEWEALVTINPRLGVIPDRIRNELLDTVKSHLREQINHGVIVPDSLDVLRNVALDFDLDPSVGSLTYQGDVNVGQLIDMDMFTDDAVEPVQAWVQHMWQDVSGDHWVGLFVLDNSGGRIDPFIDMGDGWTYVQVKVK